ncbi:MAG: mycothiol conjugate amidase Mca [Actinobacteria bacterium]|nr:mycothiol conjugate amidase Mca [Actinomycetota bacterium]
MSDRLCLLAVHAHPDDEASKGACTVHKYHEEGVRTVLVCCTGGEAGDILNPAMDTPEVRERIHDVRREELARSAGIIGYDALEWLGYKDSGMPGTPENEDPGNFANAPLDEAVGRLVAILRRERPQVVLTYSDDQQGYPHPDHIRVHDVTMAAVDAAAEPSAYVEAGEPWTVSKVYYSVWSRQRILAMHEKFLELGLESPYDQRWFDRPSQDDRITTSIDVAGLYHVRAEALRAHATQIDPDSPFWFGLSDDVASAVHPWEEWVLARSEVDSGLPELDLFSGVR